MNEDFEILEARCSFKKWDKDQIPRWHDAPTTITMSRSLDFSSNDDNIHVISGVKSELSTD